MLAAGDLFFDASVDWTGPAGQFNLNSEFGLKRSQLLGAGGIFKIVATPG
jgi:hypothetical protein